MPPKEQKSTLILRLRKLTLRPLPCHFATVSKSSYNSRKTGPIRRLERFDDAEHQAKIAKLKENAPTLARGRKTTVYALLGSTLTVLTLSAFYMTFKVYEAYLDKQKDSRYIEVEPGQVELDEDLEETLKRIEEDEAAKDREYEQTLEELKNVDLLEEME